MQRNVSTSNFDFDSAWEWLDAHCTRAVRVTIERNGHAVSRLVYLKGSSDAEIVARIVARASATLPKGTEVTIETADARHETLVAG